MANPSGTGSVLIATQPATPGRAIRYESSLALSVLRSYPFCPAGHIPPLAVLAAAPFTARPSAIAAKGGM